MAIYSVIYSGPPLHYGSTRTDKRYIAIHNTANDATAEGEASYAKRRDDSVSSHYYVDNNSILQSLDTALRAYHAGSTTGNSYAIAYEITGTNGKSRTWWLANVAWPLLARQVATDCREHDIEPRLLTVAEIKAGSKTGIITHDQMRQAWGGTTHTDPGANFPLDHLLALVQAELEVDMQVDLTAAAVKAVRDAIMNGDADEAPGSGGDQQSWRKWDLTLEGVQKLLARPPVEPAPVDVAALAAALAPHVQAAAEAAVRKVLGAVDGATPGAPA